MWRRYSAAFVLVGIALLFNVLHYLGEVVWQAQPNTSLYWLTTTAENMQSEAYQVLLAGWVFKRFFWKGTPESKDPDAHP